MQHKSYILDGSHTVCVCEETESEKSNGATAGLPYILKSAEDL